MGLCNSLMMSNDLKEQNKENKRLNKQLVKPKASMLEQHVLLLGPGESGKSTVMKQMKAMSGAFSKAELVEMKKLILQNLYIFSEALLDNVTNYSIDIRPEEIETYREMCEYMRRTAEKQIPLPNDLAQTLKQFWGNKAIEETFQNRDRFHLTGSAAYFFDHIDRIRGKDYEPTMQDIFHIRQPTKGVNEETVILKNIKLIVCDCGGQRSERRKWFQLFTDNHAVLFVAAISEYDQRIVEDESTNRVAEAIALFKVVFSGKYFRKSAIILFLNKYDIFLEKVKHIPIKDYFPAFEGENTASQGARYFRKLFKGTLPEGYENKLYIHETCAISDQVQMIINTVIDSVVQENLKDTGMI